MLRVSRMSLVTSDKWIIDAGYASSGLDNGVVTVVLDANVLRYVFTYMIPLLEFSITEL